MVGTPIALPVTTPPELTGARLGLLLLQLPPPVASDKVTVEPRHTKLGPVIAAGEGFTVMPVVVIQPVGNVYVIVAVPADMPPTVPFAAPTVPTAVLLLVQAPPADASLRVVVAPAQTVVTPVIDAGSGLTVTGVTAKQPVDNV